MYERDSQVLGRETEALRNAAALCSQEWTAEQAARLDTTDRPRNSSFIIQYEIQCPTDPAG